MTTFLNDDLAPADGDEQAESMAHDALVYDLSVALMRLDGNDGDPHTLLWTGGTVPEPWGDAWQRYEPQAQEVLNAIGEGSARALVEALSEREWVAQVVSSGPADFPLLQWRSAEVSLGVPIGTKLYRAPVSGVTASVPDVREDRDLHSHMMIVATRAAEGKASKEVLRAVCRAIAADKNLRAKLTPGVGGTDA